MASIVVSWMDPQEPWQIQIPEGEGVIITNTGEVDRLTEKWFDDELATFAHKCRTGVSMRFLPGCEAYLRMYLSQLDRCY